MPVAPSPLAPRLRPATCAGSPRLPRAIPAAVYDGVGDEDFELGRDAADRLEHASLDLGDDLGASEPEFRGTPMWDLYLEEFCTPEKSKRRNGPRVSPFARAAFLSSSLRQRARPRSAPPPQHGTQCGRRAPPTPSRPTAVSIRHVLVRNRWLAPEVAADMQDEGQLRAMLIERLARLGLGTQDELEATTESDLVKLSPGPCAARGRAEGGGREGSRGRERARARAPVRKALSDR